MRRFVYIAASIGSLICLSVIVCLVWLWLANRPINNRAFDEFNEATKIFVRFSHCGTTNTPTDMEIKDLEKVEYARAFIKNYPDNWIVPFGTPPPATSFYIEFFADEVSLGGYGVGPITRCGASSVDEDSFLVYRQTVKHIEPESRMLLIAALEIVE